METKSRYQVIGELEAKKRDLIAQKSNLVEGKTIRENKIKDIQRQQEDVNRALTRQLEDAQADLERFVSRIDEQKETLDVLIKSVDDSLDRLKVNSP